jgi:CRP/FNR family transcriptional regulator, cyclic AMP receptor protein
MAADLTAGQQPLSVAAGFVSALSADERAELQRRARSRRVKTGGMVFHEGTASDGVVVVVRGRVKVSTVTASGKEVLLAVRGPGDLLGELSAIDGLARSATVSALEPVEVLVIPSAEFRAFLEHSPRVALLLLEVIGCRLRDADRKLVEFAAYDTVGRVAARLVELVQEHGRAGADGYQITVPLSQEELAGFTGASREAVAKALRTMRELGWLITERRRVTVVDLEALRKRSM